MMLDKLLLFLFVLFYSLTGLIPSCHSALNVALNKKYTVVPVQNYSLSALPDDAISLTDGKSTFGHFWTQRTTLGWQNVKAVEVLIDLGEEFNIDSIVFSTARGKMAGVNYPVHIAAFVGASKSQFSYVGNIVKDIDDVVGPYQTKKFILNGIAAKGRYVLLVVQASGPYMFCDEIEVLAGATATAKVGTLSSKEVASFAQNLGTLEVEKNFLKILVGAVQLSVKPSNDGAQFLSDIQHRVDTLASITDVEEIRKDILSYRAEMLRAKFSGKRFFVEAVDPWASLSPAGSLIENSLQSISMTTPQGGYDHAAIVITNLMADTQEITVESSALPPEAPELLFYHVPFVKSAAMEYVADPLMPLGSRLVLSSGESRMVMLSVYGGHPGSWQGTLKVAGGAEGASFPLALKVSNVTLPSELSINSINWGYLDFKPIRDRKVEAVKDLIAHHTNTIVVPPAYLPLNYPTTPQDIVRFESYLQMHKGAAKVLLFTNFNNEKVLTVNGKYPFMSDEWKKQFKRFYKGVVEGAVKTGFSEEQLYLYPFDEMRGEEISRFKTLADWVHTEIPAVKFYATLLVEESLQILPSLAIAQVKNDDKLIGVALNSGKEIWLYNAVENTKSLPPYSYYRLMPWKAFNRGLAGVGFWNYADTGWGDNPGSAWNDFDGNRADCTVIYDGENGAIVSSRRWEAWRMGLEDYELLCMYAKAKGDKVAKALAKSVLDHPKDVNKADEVRRNIVRELSQ
ncbi:MAG: DUF4091 domain-containing protein [Chlorobium sp.]|jgi:hypothetical protein|nr:DUF4091 domain-containing protein [Chlorobium sp.]